VTVPIVGPWPTGRRRAPVAVAGSSATGWSTGDSVGPVASVPSGVHSLLIHAALVRYLWVVTQVTSARPARSSRMAGTRVYLGAVPLAAEPRAIARQKEPGLLEDCLAAGLTQQIEHR
jgi:hypothetical protein